MANQAISGVGVGFWRDKAQAEALVLSLHSTTHGVHVNILEALLVHKAMEEA